MLISAHTAIYRPPFSPLPRPQIPCSIHLVTRTASYRCTDLSYHLNPNTPFQKYRTPSQAIFPAQYSAYKYMPLLANAHVSSQYSQVCNLVAHIQNPNPYIRPCKMCMTINKERKLKRCTKQMYRQSPSPKI